MHGHKIAVNGVNIHYEKVGDGQHTVLLLPGSLGTSRTDYTPQLSGGIDPKKFTLIAWDPPGYGFSRPPERNFSGDYYRRDAMCAGLLMKTLGYNRYSVMGWSGGGTTGLILAANFPQNVHKLVVWCANAYLSSHEKFISIAGRDPETLPNSMKNVFINIYGKDEFNRMWPLLCDAYGAYDDICKSDLPKIQCPTMILHGKEDMTVSPVHAKYLSDHIPNSKLQWFNGSKHNIHHVFAEQFHKLVHEFLLSDSKL